MTTNTGSAPLVFSVPTSQDEIEIRDFTLTRKRIKFRIDDDVFEAYGILGLPLMQQLIKSAKMLGNLVKEEKFDSITSIFDDVLYPESAERFKQRVHTVGDEAIDVKEQLIPILHYLLEKYGVRPTQPSSDSSTGSPSGTDGTTSTAGQPQVELT